MSATKNIHTALAAAQLEMEPVLKGSVNDHFRSRYADLSDVVGVARPALNKHGIAYFHQFVFTEYGQMMRTVLMHGESGTSIECDVPLIVGKNDMQGMKSATTYAKRIGLESVTGIAPEDDDGNAAAKAAPSGTLTAEQVAEIKALVDETASDPSAFAKAVRAASIEAIPAADFERARGMLIKKRDKMQADAAKAQPQEEAA